MPIVSVTLPNNGDSAVASNIDDPINAILAVLNGNIDQDNLAAGGVTQSKLAAAVQAFLVPTGIINPYAGTAAPTGWLLCYGQSVLRTDYPSLFSAIGTSYGSADGTHFTIPDFRGRIPVGASAMGGSNAGRIEHSTTISTTSGSPTATVAAASGLAPGMYVVSTNVPAGTKISSISGTTITLSGNATATASGITVRFSMLGNDPEVLGAAGGEDAHQLVTNELASHLHPITGWAAGSGTDYSTPKTQQTQTNGGATGTSPATNNTGGDQPHNNMQPSLITNYIIKT